MCLERVSVSVLWRSDEQRREANMLPKGMNIEELIEFKDPLAKLVEKPEVLREALEAFEADDAETFRRLMEELGIHRRFCWMVCHYFCVVRRRLVCRILCPGSANPKDVAVNVMLELGRALVPLMENRDDLRALFDACKRVDAERFQSILEEYNLTRFCIYLCYWVWEIHCSARCWIVCE
jgi:hypothetical protein